MKYRIRKCIAPTCTVDRGTYSNFEDAYRTCKWESMEGTNAWIEKYSNGTWVKLTDLEIARKNLKTNKVNKIILQTETDIYTFKLPQTVEVPNNMRQENTGLYILLCSLGIKPTVKHKKEGE